MERASNIFARLDAYWDSDQCVIDEYTELETSHLERLRDLNVKCLEAMERFKDDEPAYWQWRIEQGMCDPHTKKPLSEVKRVSEKLLRCARAVLAARGL